MGSFASVAQYEARYGDADDPEALAEVLMDATREIAAELDKAGIAYADPDPGFADRLMQACRSMAYRAMGQSAPDVPFGATQFSEGADGYTQSFSISNPYGEVYMAKSERRLLGLGGAKARCAWPYGGPRC